MTTPDLERRLAEAHRQIAELRERVEAYHAALREIERQTQASHNNDAMAAYYKAKDTLAKHRTAP